MPRLLFLLIFIIASSSCNHTQAPRQSEVSKPEVKVPQKAEFTTTYLRGQFDPSTHPDFILIDTVYADRGGLFLRKDTYAAFLQMHAVAKAKGIDLVIRSAARNFDYQKGIWERKWTGVTKIEGNKDASIAYPDSKERALAILKYSSMPGTSRHHWGTDVDFNSFENSWFEQGEGLKLYNWLTEYGPAFGFCQPYTPKGNARPYGYEEEKWHWSYMPVSAKLTQLAESSLHNDMISGFKGSEAAIEIDVVKKYVLGINQACK